jgi:hypothetical protein
MYQLGALAVGMLFVLGFFQHWFWAVPIASALVVCLAFGKSALIPGIVLGFLLDVIIAVGVGYYTTMRLKARRAAA